MQLQQLLLLAELQQVAAAGHELLVIHRGAQEVGRPGIERPYPELAILVSSHYDDGNILAAW